MKMIDAEALKNVLFREYGDVLAEEFFDNLKSVYGVPFVDAEPIVRCRRCQYGHGCGSGGYTCTALDSDFSADFFCGFGKDKGYERTSIKEVMDRCKWN